MKPHMIYSVFWSPTGNTEKLVKDIGRQCAGALRTPWKAIDITLINAKSKPLQFRSGDLVILGMPTYAGKIPNKILPFIQDKIHGSDTWLIPAVTFGNRSFDNSLAELSHVLSQNGFSPIAGLAVVCPHAFSQTLGAGRPDPLDLVDIKNFVRHVRNKFRFAETIEQVQFPGDPHAPYYTPKGLDGEPVNFLKAKPVTDPSLCVNCGHCAALCPMEAIDLLDCSKIPGTCIKCQRCVHICKHHAKSFQDPSFLSHVAMLEKKYTRPAKNVYIW